jgi:putative tricarboxylic transport membrane protein
MILSDSGCLLNAPEKWSLQRLPLLPSFALTPQVDSDKLSIVMNRERAGGLFFLFVGLCFLSFSSKLPIGKLTQPGPAIFPFILSLLLSLMGVLILFSGRGKPKTGRAEDREHWVKPLAIILLTLAFIVLMGPVGYLVTSFFYLFSLFFLVSRFKLLFSACLSGILAAGSWYFFGKILGIFLPLGPWNL